MTPVTNMNTYPFAGLEPASVWAHFAALCRIPRQSKHEKAVVAFLKDWADSQGLESLVDKGGNLIIRKAATPGRENLPGVILQGHLDMVCQKNEGVEHDFSKDPIRPQVNGNTVTADNTTLGADDGIGVALALAALEDKTLQHGPLEALFTVDEEEGMGGANNLETGVLQGSILLNLDSETWGEFCIGCAGGLDVTASRQHQVENIRHLFWLKHWSECVVGIRLVDNIQIAWMLSYDMVKHALNQNVSCWIIRIANPVDTVLWQHIHFIFYIIRYNVVKHSARILVFAECGLWYY